MKEPAIRPQSHFSARSAPYLRPAVLELGSRRASDAGTGMQAVWEHIGSGAAPRGLRAAEHRLLAFLRKQPRQRGAAKA